MEIQVSRDSLTFSLSPQQQACVLQLFEPLFDNLVDRMAVKAKQLTEAAKPRYYSRRELAELLHISLPTLHGYVKNGKLKPQRIDGRVLFGAADVDALIESGRLQKYSRR